MAALRGAAVVSGESKTGVDALVEAGDDHTAGTRRSFEGKESLLRITPPANTARLSTGSNAAAGFRTNIRCVCPPPPPYSWQRSSGVHRRKYFEFAGKTKSDLGGGISWFRLGFLALVRWAIDEACSRLRILREEYGRQAKQDQQQHQSDGSAPLSPLRSHDLGSLCTTSADASPLYSPSIVSSTPGLLLADLRPLLRLHSVDASTSESQPIDDHSILSTVHGNRPSTPPGEFPNSIARRLLDVT